MNKEINGIARIDERRIAKMKKTFAEFLQGLGGHHKTELNKKELARVRGSIIATLLIHGRELENTAWKMDAFDTDPFVRDDVKNGGTLILRRNDIVDATDEVVKKTLGIEMLVTPELVLRRLIAERLVRADMAERMGYKEGDWAKFHTDARVVYAGNLAIGGVNYQSDKALGRIGQI